jgi:hypothetical protein
MGNLEIVIETLGQLVNALPILVIEARSSQSEYRDLEDKPSLEELRDGSLAPVGGPDNDLGQVSGDERPVPTTFDDPERQEPLHCFSDRRARAVELLGEIALRPHPSAGVEVTGSYPAQDLGPDLRADGLALDRI